VVAGPGPVGVCGLIRSLTTGVCGAGVSHHSPAVSAWTGNRLRPLRAKEMNAMTSLQEFAEVVIGVDTHVATHSAAAVDARTGGVLAELTVPATPDGYQALVDFAGEHAGLRAWAIEGTGGHGAGLARVLGCRGDPVVELDRPERTQRRNGAKSDPLDAIRAA